MTFDPHGLATAVAHPIIVCVSCFLRHLDNHHLWEPNEFAVSCFRIIMYSIQVRPNLQDTDAPPTWLVLLNRCIVGRFLRPFLGQREPS